VILPSLPELREKPLSQQPKVLELLARLARCSGAIRSGDPLRVRHAQASPRFLKSPLLGPVELRSPFGKKRLLIDYQTRETAESLHEGVDLAAFPETQMFSPSGGTVFFAGELPVGGICVGVSHEAEGFHSLLCHLNQAQVAVGQRVTEGQLLGLTGASGRASGPHLHWSLIRIRCEAQHPEIRWVDPMSHLKRKGTTRSAPLPDSRRSSRFE
jgi:murein DD-endopeptidase MepM/ murein hydrolase activator NlpD